MKTATNIFAACAFFLSMFMPVLSSPLPAPIQVEGRSFMSRFAPLARPVFPRSYYDNSTAKVEVEKRHFPLPSGTLEERNFFPFPTGIIKRNYPAGPTASALVFRSEHMS